MKRLITTLILSLVIATTGYAASDVMVSLFKFQRQMVAQGNVEAIMKLGEMYEQGRGTKKDFNKALEMYKKALAQGHADAAKAIRRVEKAKKQGVRNLEIEKKKKRAHEKSVREKAAREKAAQAEAARGEAAREAAEKEKIMRAEAAMEKAAREEVVKEKIMREKTAVKKAVREEVTGGNVMPEKTVRGKTTHEKVLKEKAIKARVQQKSENKAPGMGWDDEDPEDDD